MSSDNTIYEIGRGSQFFTWGNGILNFLEFYEGVENLEVE